MLRRLESYEVDIIRLRAINAAKDTELASLRDQLQVFSEVKDVIANILTDLPHPVPAPSQQLLQQPVVQVLLTQVMMKVKKNSQTRRKPTQILLRFSEIQSRV